VAVKIIVARCMSILRMIRMLLYAISPVSNTLLRSMTFDFSLRRTLVTARTHAQNQVQKPVVKNNYREEPDGKTDTTDRITIIAKWEFIGFQ